MMKNAEILSWFSFFEIQVELMLNNYLVSILLSLLIVIDVIVCEYNYFYLKFVFAFNA